MTDDIVAMVTAPGIKHHQHQLLPTVQSNATCQVAQSWGGHPHASLDLHQVFSGGSGGFLSWLPTSLVGSKFLPGKNPPPGPHEKFVHVGETDPLPR